LRIAGGSVVANMANSGDKNTFASALGFCVGHFSARNDCHAHVPFFEIAQFAFFFGVVRGSVLVRYVVKARGFLENSSAIP
jgi:hypothetical protein